MPNSPSMTPRPLLSIRNVYKEFPGVVALNDVSLDVHGGEIVAVLGHNGSGKSTLVKILAGVYQSDGGDITVGEREGGTEMHFIHQELGLIGELTAVENLELTRGAGTRALSPHRGPAELQKTRESLARFGTPFDVDVPIQHLSAAQRTIIAIARALDGWGHERNILVLDEPTEALHSSEVEVLFSAIRNIASRGAGVIFISHRLDEVLTLADRIVVLRDGAKVADVARDGVDHERLVQLVTGAASSVPRTQASQDRGSRALEVSGLSGANVSDIDLDVCSGEIVGIAGVLGSGREEVPSLLFGAAPGNVSEFKLMGRSRELTNPRESIDDGLAYVPGDRARLGGIMDLCARENMTLPRLKPHRRLFGRMDTNTEVAEANGLMARFGVVPANPEQTLASFSGGNQQKLVISRWMRNDPTVLLLEEPTQGVDVGAKVSIYNEIVEAAGSGTAVLICSSDARELAELCSRVYVLRDGRVTRVLTGDEVTEDRIVREGYGLGLGCEADSTWAQEN